MEKPATPAHPILDALSHRWSGRAIDPSLPVSPEHVSSILEAARWSPSCFNEQPWRFILFDDRDPAAREDARACLAPGNAWAKSAPVLLLAVAVRNRVDGGTPNRFAEHDVGMACQSMAIQACSLGLVVHFMGGYDPERARRSFTVPPSMAPMAMVAIGHPLPVERLAGPARERELAPRTRRTIEEFVFRGKWGRG
jgi:nitroreductase